MAQHAHGVKQLIHGVSQQDSTVRLDNQVEEQINGLSDVTFGLIKRNPVKFVSKIKNTPFLDRVISSFKYINSSGNEEKCFLLIAQPVGGLGSFQVYRLSDGKIFTLTAVNPYLANDDLPTKKDLVVVEDGENLYILNKKIPVTTMANNTYDATPYNVKNAMIWVNYAAYRETFTVTIKWRNKVTLVEGSSTLSVTTGPSAGSGISPDLPVVASNIASGINAWNCGGGLAPFYTVEKHNVVMIAPYNADILSIVTTDDRVNYDLRYALNAQGFDYSITDASILPRLGDVEGFKVRVTPDPAHPATTYILQKKGDSWSESCIEYPTMIDPNSFVHYVKKDDLNTNAYTVTLRTLENFKRTSGDILSNPDPSFIGKTLNDLFLFNSRLGVATADTIVLSGVDTFGNFYKTTTATLRQDDRIDVTLDSSKLGYGTIKTVTTINGQLLINTGASQAILYTTAGFDLSKSRLVESSAYNLGNLKGIPVGNQLYFAIDNENGFVNLHNYQVDPVSGVNYISEQLDKHCSNYIKGKVRNVQYANNTTLITTDDDLRTIYVHNRYAPANTLIQNSFNKWTFAYDIEYIDFIDNILYIVFIKDGVTFLGSLDLLVNQNKTYVKPLYHTFTIRVPENTNLDITKWLTLKCASEEIMINAASLDSAWDIEQAIATLPLFVGPGVYAGKYITGTTLQSMTETLPGIYRFVISGYDFIEPFHVTGNTLVSNVGATPAVITLTYDQTIGTHTGATIGYKPFLDLGLPYIDPDLENDVIAISNPNGTKYLSLAEAEVSFEDVVYGVPYTTEITLSKQLLRQKSREGLDLYSFGKVHFRRFNFIVDNTGSFNVDVEYKNRETKQLESKPNPLGSIVLDIVNVTERNFKTFISGNSDDIVIKVISGNSEPFNLVGFEWLGVISTKGRRI